MGGGGGQDNSAQQHQEAIEQEKARARAEINQLFGIGGTVRPAKTPATGGSIADMMSSVAGTEEPYAPDVTSDNATARQASYDKVRGDVLAYEKNQLDEDKTPAERNLKFALLRSGNSGGGLDIDQNTLLDKTYDNGLLKATNDADAASLSAKSSDEQARLNILSGINAGMDQSSAIAGANAALANSSAQATAAAKGQTFGNAFDNAGLLYQIGNSNAGSGDAAALYSKLFGSKSPTVGSASTGYSGTTTRT